MMRSIAIGFLAAAVLPLASFASSHREAPDIAGLPRLDGTDLYMFRSYEPGREDYVTPVANYVPFQDPFGGPNFYHLDPEVSSTENQNLNVVESYTLTVTRSGWGSAKAENATLGGTEFYKPVDNIGEKSIANYPAYADSFIYSVNIPGCSKAGRVFVGQRKDPFFVNLGGDL